MSQLWADRPEAHLAPGVGTDRLVYLFVLGWMPSGKHEGPKAGTHRSRGRELFPVTDSLWRVRQKSRPFGNFKLENSHRLSSHTSYERNTYFSPNSHVN